MSSIAKLSSFSTIEEFGRKLIKLHRPATIDWKKKFGVKEKNDVKDGKLDGQEKAGYFCARCKANISAKEARFCWNNKSRFNGKAFCYKCQKQFQP